MSQCRWSMGSVNVFGRAAQRAAGDRTSFHSLAHAPSRFATDKFQNRLNRDEKRANETISKRKAMKCIRDQRIGPDRQDRGLLAADGRSFRPWICEQLVSSEPEF